MFKFHSIINGVEIKSSALSTAYKIHGDGIARMIPEKLINREKFQENMKEIDELFPDAPSPDQKIRNN